MKTLAVSVLVLLCCIVLLRLLGIRLFRRCPNCSSRLTYSSKGFIPVFSSSPESEDTEWKFVEDIKCADCEKSLRIQVPRERWPKKPFIPE